MKRLSLFFFLWLIMYSGSAQNDKILDGLTPAARNERDAALKEWAVYKKTETDSVVYIPTVVHVLYHNHEEDIADSLIIATINDINLCLLKQNSELNQVPAFFKALASSSNMQLCLASVDANYNSTTGIVHKYTSIDKWQLEYRDTSVQVEHMVQDSMKYSVKGGDDGWAPTSYLNIWIANVDAQPPTAWSTFSTDHGKPVDGIVIAMATSFKKEIVTHEFGHYFDLFHTWGFWDGCEPNDPGDGIADTPDEGDRHMDCPPFPVLDNCSPVSPGVNVHNFMDYTDCRSMFTKGQVDKMNASLHVYRSSLLQSKGCNVLSKTDTTTFSIFPNPGTKQLNITVGNNQLGAWLSIYSITGQRVLATSFQSDKLILDVASYAAGVYIVEVKANGAVYRIKWAKL